jgi:branched-chain amino acid transport system substrate-binding protein
MLRRDFLMLTAALAAGGIAGAPEARAAETPGVTKTEIKIGQTQSYSGPASSYGAIGKVQQAYFDMINAQGGINGRKITFLSLDDGYSPPRTVEQTRKLVEQEGVAIMFNSLGTPTNSAVQKYLNQKKVPQLFVATGGDKWGDPEHFPWTMGWQTSYRAEAQIYAKYILAEKPNAKIGLLYQNDDFGKDYVNGLKDVLGADRFAKMVTVVSYEATDATIDSQLVSLKTAGADVLITATVPKFGAMSIRKVHELDWHPMHIMSNVAISVGTVIEPGGKENAIGLISADFRKDATDPTWKDDAGIKQWRDFMNAHMPGADQADNNYLYGYSVVQTLMQVLKQCGDDLSRENIMKQAANIKDQAIPTLLPGILVNTSPTNFHPLRQLQLQRWDGKAWVLFGKVLQAD